MEIKIKDERKNTEENIEHYRSEAIDKIRNITSVKYIKFLNNLLDSFYKSWGL